MTSLVALLLPLLAVTAIIVGADGLNSIAPKIRGAARQHLQQRPQTTIRALAADPARELQEFCGQCTWEGAIVCEARAQYLVQTYAFASIAEARASILAECTSDGSEEVKLPLDAFCGTCPWQNMNFDCRARAEFLVGQYKLSMEKAMEGLLEKGECVDPNYKPAKAEDGEEDSDGMSLGAIIGIVVGVTAFLMCLIVAWAYRRERNQKKPKPREVSVPVELPASAAPLPLRDVVQMTNNQNAHKKKRKPKSISFVENRPDPPGESKCETKEYKYEDGLHHDGEETATESVEKKSDNAPEDETMSEEPKRTSRVKWNWDPPTEEDAATAKDKEEPVVSTEERPTNTEDKEEDAAPQTTKAQDDDVDGRRCLPEADAAAGTANKEGAATDNEKEEPPAIIDCLDNEDDNEETMKQ